MKTPRLQRKVSSSSLNTEVSSVDNRKLISLVQSYWRPNDILCLRQQINLRKLQTFKKVFDSIHTSKLVSFKEYRTAQKFMLSVDEQTKKCQIYIQYDEVKDYDNVPYESTEELIKCYMLDYKYLLKLCGDYSRKYNALNKSKHRIDVEYLFELNTYVFLAARKLHLQLKLNVDLMMENMQFEYSKQKIKEIQKSKILEIALYLNQRLDHAEIKAKQFKYFQKINDFAQHQFELRKQYKLFGVLRKIRSLITRIRKRINQFVNSGQITDLDEQELMLFCQFIGKLEGPKCRTSQFLLFELQHIKSMLYLFKVKSHQKQFRDLICTTTEEICGTVLAQMKCKLVFSDTPKLYMNTHGFRFEELKILLQNLFASLSRWRRNGDLNKILKASERNERQAFVFLQIQQGFGNHTQKQELTIRTALRKFKEQSQDKQESILKKTNIDYQLMDQFDQAHILIVKIYFQDLVDWSSQTDFPRITASNDRVIIMQAISESDFQFDY